MKRSKWSKLNSVGYVTMLLCAIVFIVQGELLLVVGALVMAGVCFNQIEVVE